jgi:hypothetical protein
MERTTAAICSMIGMVLMAMGAAGTFGDPVHGDGRLPVVAGAALAIIGGTYFAKSKTNG